MESEAGESSSSQDALAASPSSRTAGPLTPPPTRRLQLIKALDNARGNGTSMISLIMPPKSQVRRRRRPARTCCCILSQRLCWQLPGVLGQLKAPQGHCSSSSSSSSSSSTSSSRPSRPSPRCCIPAAAAPPEPPPGTAPLPPALCPAPQVAQTSAMLANEYGTASNIKSRVNRQSVLGAITSAQQRLKLYTRVPPNGLVIYTGTVMTEDGKEKKMNIDFEPFKPINTSLYLCDNKFHTEALNELLEADNK